MRGRRLALVTSLAAVAALVVVGVISLGSRDPQKQPGGLDRAGSAGSQAGAVGRIAVLPGCTPTQGAPVAASVADEGRQPNRSVQAARIRYPGPAAATSGWHRLVHDLDSCPGTQLLSLRAVHGIGAAADLVTLRRPADHAVQTVQVAMARSGQFVGSVVVRTASGWPLPPAQVVDLLAKVMKRCPSSGCDASTYEIATASLPSHQPTGFLADIDLPVFAAVTAPWAATGLSQPTQNPAATPCDQADFRRAGARSVHSRSYLVPTDVSVSPAFGLDETVGRFANAGAATAFVKKVSATLASCSARDLSMQARRMGSFALQSNGVEETGQAWQVSVHTSKSAVQMFRMALVRRGDQVAQVRFTPAHGADVSPRVFLALARRAADRLPSR